MKKYHLKSQYQKNHFSELQKRNRNKDIKESVPQTDKNTTIIEGFDRKLKKTKKFSQVKFLEENTKVLKKVYISVLEIIIFQNFYMKKKRYFPQT